MKSINLTRGHFVIIDDEDYEIVSKHKWCATRKMGETYYAIRGYHRNGKLKSVLMHRMIMNPGKNVFIDHLNGNGLDNRKANLRLCNNSKNQGNSKLRKDNTSGVKGVSMHHGRWYARIRINGKLVCIGSFLEKKEAATSYKLVAARHFGEFANCVSDAND